MNRTNQKLKDSDTSTSNEERIDLMKKPSDQVVLGLLTQGSQSTLNGDGKRGPGRQKSTHYSTLRNKPVNFDVMVPFENRIMLNVDVPRFFHLDPPSKQLQRARSNSSRKSTPKKGKGFMNLPVSIEAEIQAQGLVFTENEKD